MWMPVTDTTKPNDNLGSVTTSYKEQYSSMKVKLKDILYENELIQDEVKRLQRELLDIYRDKEALLERVVQYENCLATSESDSESNPKNPNNNNINNNNSADLHKEPNVTSNNNIINKVTTKKAPIKRTKPTKTAETKTADAKPAPTKPAPTKSASTKPAPAKSAPAKPATTKSATAKSAQPKPAPAKRQRSKPAPKKQQQTQQQPQLQQQQPPQTHITQLIQQPQQQLQLHQQQQPMTVIGQVQVSLPNDQVKFIQHMNLPIQNSDSTNLIMTSNANHMQTQQQQQQQQQQQNHHIISQHQPIHFQLPQTALTSGMVEGFQTPQSIITTQGNQINFRQQNYTIVATTNSTGNLIHHDSNQLQLQLQQQQQHIESSPPQHQQMISQIVPMNQIIQQDLPSISPHQVQNHSPDQQHQHINHHQHHQSQPQRPQQQHQNSSQYQHSVVQYQHQQQSNHIHQTQVQQNRQPQQAQQQPQEDQICSNDDFEQNLEVRRIEQAALLMPDWESSVPSELFGSDSTIKFMAED